MSNLDSSHQRHCSLQPHNRSSCHSSRYRSGRSPHTPCPPYRLLTDRGVQNTGTRQDSCHCQHSLEISNQLSGPPGLTSHLLGTPRPHSRHSSLECEGEGGYRGRPSSHTPSPWCSHRVDCRYRYSLCYSSLHHTGYSQRYPDTLSPQDRSGCSQ